MPAARVPLYHSTGELSVRAHFPPDGTEPGRASPAERFLAPTGIPLKDRMQVIRSGTEEAPRVGKDPLSEIRIQ